MFAMMFAEINGSITLGLAGAGAGIGVGLVERREQLAVDYDVIMPDARGHGRSDAPEEGYGDAFFAADLAAVIQGLGLDHPPILGHSMGAGISSLVHLARTTCFSSAWKSNAPLQSGQSSRW